MLNRILNVVGKMDLIRNRLVFEIRGKSLKNIVNIRFFVKYFVFNIGSNAVKLPRVCKTNKDKPQKK